MGVLDIWAKAGKWSNRMDGFATWHASM
jgi:hypothetical protein